VKKNERLIKVALMCKDLDFNFPHKIHIQQLKSSLVKDLEVEENKLREFLLKKEETEKKKGRAKKAKRNDNL